MASLCKTTTIALLACIMYGASAQDANAAAKKQKSLAEESCLTLIRAQYLAEQTEMQAAYEAHAEDNKDALQRKQMVEKLTKCTGTISEA
jgi:hypothetical protein